MLALYLTEAAVGCLIILLAVPPRAAGRKFFQLSVAMAAALVLGGIGLEWPGDRSGTAVPWLFLACTACLLVAAGFFHLGRFAPGSFLMVTGLAAGLAGVIADAIALIPSTDVSGFSRLLYSLDAVTAGLVTGSVLMAMILGHYYLNIPGLAIRYLQRLCLLCLGAIIARSLVVAIGVTLHRATLGPLVGLLLDTGSAAPPAGGVDPFVLVLLILQVAFGLLAPLAFTFMAWRTARIASTQSATGILYVALIAVIIGELTGRYLVTLTHLPL
ncbi:MAG: hypothetical protein ACE5HU_00205 [Acidobacteriota bacterium]